MNPKHNILAFLVGLEISRALSIQASSWLILKKKLHLLKIIELLPEW
jgi:hypothetical protein